MKCPEDQSTLVLAERQGIEIDYCPECRGVWLDRGELDKIVERSTVGSAPVPGGERRAGMAGQEQYRDGRRHDGDAYDDDDRFERTGKRRRSSFLGELFDLG